jgi:hypothetical protein
MNELFCGDLWGLPFWYYWGAITVFGFFFYENKERRAQSGTDFGAWLGISMVWIFIPIYYAGWIVYNVFKLLKESGTKDIPQKAFDINSYISPYTIKVVRTFVIPQGEVKLVERDGRSFLMLGKKTCWIPFGVVNSDLTAETVAQIIANQPVVFSTPHGDVELCTGIYGNYLKWGKLKLRIPQNVVPDNVNIDIVLETIAKHKSKRGAEKDSRLGS